MPQIPPDLDPRKSTRGNYEYWEVFLAQGPNAIGDTRDNELIDFIGREWLLVLDESGYLKLYLEDSDEDGSWTQVVANLPPIFDEVQPDSRRRFSFAFDQSARVILAYEEDETTYLTRWDIPTNQYVQDVVVAGVDPVVVFDATWNYYVPDSDVILLYVDAVTKSTIQYRLQRESYATERELYDYGTPVIMDRVTSLPLRYQIIVSDDSGDPRESGGERVGLLSDPYPYRASESAYGDITIGSGAYRLRVIAYDVDAPERASGDIGIASATYTSLVGTVSLGPELATGDLAIKSGLYTSLTASVLGSPEAADGDLALESGAYRQLIIEPLVSPEAADGNLGIVGGTYRAV